MKIPKIKVCNPSPFTKNVFCDVIDETMSRVIRNHVLRFFFYYYYSVFSLRRPASIYYLFIYWNKRKRLHKKRVQLHRTGLGHKHGRRFIVLGYKYGYHDVM